MARGARATANDGNRRASNHLFGHFDRRRFDEEHRRARRDHRVCVGQDLDRVVGRLPRGEVAADLLRVLRSRTDVRDDRNPRATHLGDNRRERRVHFQFDDVGSALGHESTGVAHRFRVIGVVTHEGHVGHDQGARRAAFDRGSEQDQKIKRRMKGVGKSENHLGRGVAY